MNDLFDIACNFTHESFDDDLKQVINDAISKDWDVTIFSIDGSFKSNSKNYNIIELSYLNIRKISNILKKNNFKNITMIGYIPRPNNMSAYLNLSNILFYLKLCLEILKLIIKKSKKVYI